MRYLGAFGVILFLAFWLVWGYRYIKCTVLGDCQPKVAIDSAALKKASHTLFLMLDGKPVDEGYPEFVFNYASAGATYLDEHETFLKMVAAEMNGASKEHLLVLIGRCTQAENEKSQTKGLYENLGKARALAVADKLVAEQQIPQQRIEIRGEIMPDTGFFSPLQFILRPFDAKEFILETTEEDIVAAADTLHVVEDSTKLNTKNEKRKIHNY